MVKETETSLELDLNEELAKFTVHGYSHLDFINTDEATGKQDHILGDTLHISIDPHSDHFVGRKVGTKFFPGVNTWEIGATYEPIVKLDFVKGKLEAKISGYRKLN